MAENEEKISPVKFNEYKTIVEDTARFTDRRQNASNLYVTVNSLLLTAIAFIVKDANLKQIWILFFSIPLVVAGIYVSSWWKQLLDKYKKLNKVRFDILWEMEEKDELEGIEKIYHREDELYPRDEHGNIIQGEGLNFSDLENKLPTLFITLYIIALIGVAITFIISLIKLYL